MKKQFKIRVCLISSFQTQPQEHLNVFKLNTVKNQTKYQYFYGKIQEIGDSLRIFQIDQQVIVFLPFNHENCFNLQNKSLSVDDQYIFPIQVKKLIQHDINIEQFLAALPYVFSVYNGLYKQAQFKQYQKVLIIDPFKTGGQIIAQLVNDSFIVCKNNSELIEMQKICNKNDVFLQKDYFKKNILEHTLGMGVDIILDFSKLHSNQEKNDLIELLSPSGKWIIFEDFSIQLFPYETQILYMKNASIHFSFGEALLAFGCQQGKLFHILEDFCKHKLNFFIEKEIEYQEYERLDQKFKSNYFILTIKN